MIVTTIPVLFGSICTNSTVGKHTNELLTYKPEFFKKSKRKHEQRNNYYVSEELAFYNFLKFLINLLNETFILYSTLLHLSPPFNDNEGDFACIPFVDDPVESVLRVHYFLQPLKCHKRHRQLHQTWPIDTSPRRKRLHRLHR